MIEVTVLNYLNENLDAPVLMELPEVPSEDYPTFPAKLPVTQRLC